MECYDSATALTTVLAIGLFITSEILPFVSNVKSNGLMEAIISVVRKKTGEETPITQV